MGHAAMQAVLDHEAAEEAIAKVHHPVQTVSFHVKAHGDDEQRGHDEDQASDSDVSFDKLEASTASTNTSALCLSTCTGRTSATSCGRRGEEH